MPPLSSVPVRYPRTVVAVVLALTAAFGVFAADVRVNSSVDNLLPRDDPARLYYEDVKRTFGSDEAGVVGVFAADVFAPETIAKIAALSEDLAGIAGVRQVLSLATVMGVETDEWGAMRVGRLLKSPPQTQAEARAFRERLLANRFYAGKLVSPDETATGIAILFEPLTDEEFIDRDIDGQIRARVARYAGPEEFAVTGIQTLKVNSARLMEQDLQRFLPISLLVVVLILAWAFRTVRGVLLPLLAVTVGVVWTTGLMVLTGEAINLGTLVLPPLLMAIGIAYAIHVVSRYYQELQPGRDRVAVAEATVGHVRLPVGVAALTTLIGFASLTLSEIPAIRDFGIFAVFGIAAIFVVSATLIPALLVLLPEARRGRDRFTREDWVTRGLQRLALVAIRYRRTVLLVSLVVVVVGIFGIRQIRVETDYLQFLDPDTPIRAENTRIAERLGGTQPIYIVVDGEGTGAISRLSVLAAIKDLQDFMAELPKVDGSLSIVDYVTVVREVLNPDEPPGLPDTQAEVNQLMLFVDAKELAPIATKDMSRANIIVGTRLSGSAEVGAFVARVEDFAQRRFHRDVDVTVTGTMVLLNRSADALARGQLFGLLQVLGVLLVLMSALFLSLRAGLLSLVPNVLPIVVLLGLMGYTGITLNISTSMIAVIAIGIAIDDTIHYLSEFNQQTRRTGSEEQAILRAGRSVGRAMVITSVVLCAGFLVVCVSNFIPIRHFGILASATMVIALLFDLVVTPALVMTAHIVTVWDLLYTRLGTQPHKEIPLFAGLRPFQAKIVVLMGQLARAAPGEMLTRQGEFREELYVLLNGRVEVRRSEDNRVIRVCGRGEVIGEMGLVRHKPRSADIMVAEETEYIVLDAAAVERIQRRYPRIAAVVFQNLTKILSDRLENTTNQLVLALQAGRRG